MLWYQVYFGVLVLLVFNVQKGTSSVRCYSCSSKQEQACIKPSIHELSLVKCDTEALQKTQQYARSLDSRYEQPFDVDMLETNRPELACLKVVTKVNNRDYIVRGCQLAEQSNLDICRRLEKENSASVHLVHCSKCSEEGCNSTSSISNNILLILISFVVCKLLHLVA